MTCYPVLVCVNIGGYIAVSSCHLFPENTPLKIPQLTAMFLNYKINPKITIFDDYKVLHIFETTIYVVILFIYCTYLHSKLQ